MRNGLKEEQARPTALTVTLMLTVCTVSFLKDNPVQSWQDSAYWTPKFPTVCVDHCAWSAHQTGLQQEACFQASAPQVTRSGA